MIWLSEHISGKVIKIISLFSVIIDVGTNEGVKRGMKFIIYEEGDVIKDPTSNNSLGRLELVKATVEVEHVQPNLSLTSSLTQNYKDLSLTALIGFPRTMRSPLPIDENSITPLSKKDADKIKVGDLVRNIC